MIPLINVKFSYKIPSFDSWKADLWNAIPGGPAQMGALKKLLCRFHICMKAWNNIAVMLAAMSWSWLDLSQFAEGEKRGCMGGHLVPHQPPSIPPPCICRNCQKYFRRGKVTAHPKIVVIPILILFVTKVVKSAYDCEKQSFVKSGWNHKIRK